MTDRMENTSESGRLRPNIDVVPFAPSFKDTWNSFIETSNNGTEFHRTDFLDYHHEGKFDFRHLMFYRDGKLVSVLPGSVIDGVYRSPSGASLGGFILAPYAGLEIADASVASFVSWCQAEGLMEAFIAQPIPVYRRLPDESMEFALLYNGFTICEALYSSVSDLEQTGDRLQMPIKTRYNINRSERYGVEVVESDDFSAFYPILMVNKMKFGCGPTHTLEDLERIRELRPNLLRLFLAMLDGKPIAGLMLFLISQVCALNFYTAQDYEYHKYNPVSFLIEHSMGWCREKGYRHYDYGVSMDTASPNPLEVSWSLVQFKESLGLTGCVRKTYCRKIQAPDMDSTGSDPTSTITNPSDENQ